MEIVCRRPNSAAPARIAPLSVLPVFIDLAGKRAVVAGGSDAAAWKLELLLAAGAQVALLAPLEELGPEMTRLMAREGGSDRLVHQRAGWSHRDLSGAVMAILDAKDDAEAAEFAGTGRAAGVMVNVIDRPNFCSFQFGSIVNRSPVVVGISTAGAAPILGQGVRRRIETLLPASLSLWGALARRLRSTVNASLTPGHARRAFWEQFTEHAFGEPPEADDAAVLSELTAAARSGEKAGMVTFVGAGPGDPEHLTLKAIRTLQAADVILFDEKVSAGVLELARREAKRILVGSACDGAEEVGETMLRLVKAGRRVVRLHPGQMPEPARLQAEIARLRQADVSFAVVPGVTQVSTAPTNSGTPTHSRLVNRSM